MIYKKLFHSDAKISIQYDRTCRIKNKKARKQNQNIHPQLRNYIT